MHKFGRTMSSISDPSHRYSSIKPTLIKEAAKSVILKFQRNFRLFPREICLISGGPRSGTSALCEWLGHQPGVSAFHESRILVSIHRFMEEIYRFRNLDKDSPMIVSLARHLVFDYYSSSRILLGKRLLVDKEPLEPIAFPSKEYRQFIINMKRLFPESKLLLAIRDPIATIWSMRKRTWGESLTNIETKKFTVEEYIENWCSCADLILQYRSDPNTYIVQFGRLVNDPENESRRILGFLNVREGDSFQPRQTKEIGFSNEEREKILRIVQPQLEMLRVQGISEFC
jgi:hypothetical protein